MTQTSGTQERSEQAITKDTIRPLQVNVPDAELTELRGCNDFCGTSEAVMMHNCLTCKWIRWSASIPLTLLLGAGGFVVFAHFAEVQHDAPAALLGLYLATWSYVLAIAGVILLSGWWLWKCLHIRTAHALGPS